MNIGVFAADLVGCEIIKFFKDKNEPLSCLVLDARDSKGMNAKILTHSKVLKVFYSDSLYEENTLLQLRALNLDLIILAWWPYIIKDCVIEIPKLGCLNLHPSYLPYNRGKDPNFWSLVEDVPFGVSIHFVTAGIDSGDVVCQTRIQKSWEDTGKTLYEKAVTEIVKLFKDNFEKIKSGNLPRKPQDLNLGSFHRRSELDPASMIDLNKNYRACDLLNLLRARTFVPHPAAWFVDNNEKFEVRIEIQKVTNDRNLK
jgi:methionyl-tRNA formyltransferase